MIGRIFRTLEIAGLAVFQVIFEIEILQLKRLGKLAGESVINRLLCDLFKNSARGVKIPIVIPIVLARRMLAANRIIFRHTRRIRGRMVYAGTRGNELSQRRGFFGRR